MHIFIKQVSFHYLDEKKYEEASGSMEERMFLLQTAVCLSV